MKTSLTSIEMERFFTTYGDLEHLSSGTFGTVSAGKRLATGEHVIIKTVFKWKWAEVETLIACQNIEGVVKLDEFFHDCFKLVLIMPGIPNCQDLFTFIDQEGFLSGPVAKRLFGQLVSAVGAMFDLNFIHGDLKPENCVVDHERLTLTLIDFGSARKASDEPFDFLFGTKIFTPPEAFEREQFHSMPSTVWTLGMILFEMMIGACAFETEEDIVKPLTGLDFVCNEGAESLISKCLERDPEDRISLRGILDHSWLN